MTPILYTPTTKPMFSLRTTKSATSLSTISKIENQLHRVYSKLGLQKLDGRNNNINQKNDDYSFYNNKSNAVSPSALSQRLLNLQQQQQQQNNYSNTRQPIKGNMIINNKDQNNNTSIIKMVLLSLMSLEKKIAYGITQLLFNYRLWIYCFILVTYLLRRRRLNSLPLLIQYITNRQPYLKRYISH